MRTERSHDYLAATGVHDDIGFMKASDQAAMMGAEQVIYDSLPHGHMLRTLIREHRDQMVLLDQLEAHTARLQTSTGERGHLLIAMAAIAARLKGADSHHTREEEVLFFELTRRGILGPPMVMAAEHSDMRRLKAEILESSEAMLEGGGDHRIQLVRAARELVELMRTHIAKENNVLYPIALGLLRDDALWDDMKRRCDAIGYGPAPAEDHR